MRKNAFKLTVYVLALSAFGGFFRWLQDQTSFEADTGLLIPGPLNYIVPLVFIVCAAVFYLLVKKLGKTGLDFPGDVYSIFNGKMIAYPIVYWAAAIVTVLGGFLTLRQSAYTAAPVLVLLLGLSAAVTGIGFAMLCSTARRNYSPGLASTLMTLPIVTYCLWLITSYKLNASTPSVWAYAVEIIAVCVALIAFYYNAGFAFCKPQPQRSLFFSMTAAFMCLTALADSRPAGLQLILIGTVIMLLCEAWMLIVNMHEPVPESNADPEPEAEPELVIEPGSEAPEEEPTKEAPEWHSGLNE